MLSLAPEKVVAAAAEAAATSQPEATLLIEVEGVRKTFPGVVALDNASFRLRPGTVHALMGENGAGKSTLMKILAGVHEPDKGVFRLRGRDIVLKSPLDALEHGIAMIHQELNLMPYMSVAENIWIRREPLNRLGMVDHGRMNQMTRELLQQLSIELDPESNIIDLSISARQMVEIAKAVSYDSDVLIMDEPTSALTEHEVSHLFRIIRELRAAGKGIIYITHKMNELAEIADEVTVFRDGRFIGCKQAERLERDEIISMMVGREITEMFPKEPAKIGDVALTVRGLTLDGVFSDVSFEVRQGEILGVAGLIGSGRSNVAETLFGVTPASAGSISIFGKAVTVDSPQVAMAQGMAFLTEDRKDTGCFLNLSILENMQISVLNDDHLTAGFVHQKTIDQLCESMAATLRVKAPGLYERVENLSGGNQQKVLIGRWLLTNPRILILDEPTRGIDVGAKAEIHRLISKLAGQGVAVIMISSELPEVLGMSDRIMVMHGGRVTGILDRADADQVSIMQLAAS
ncbi:sugar ABC transporter ATP-binding protein [Vogesella sp. AC12]|uniref:sugar ABC transporter ATP-binding protein n=1 Tax=Vogesella sp. AC12 TaxID=2950550 RepID=UPI002109B365|nr:sugar ABC transporter ATP-binding protein [Vogesella sp. AC12]MCQ4143445.1 sugar ABC transporter ATP-binding protein [Vogesella sp. AC12]